MVVFLLYTISGVLFLLPQLLHCQQTGNCVDLVNPKTGASDCPSRAYLCNNPIYYAVMTEQCPKTCNRCSSTSPPSADCADRINPRTGVSDCPSRAYLCNNALYFALMTQECPKTCNRCPSTTTKRPTTAPPSTQPATVQNSQATQAPTTLPPATTPTSKGICGCLGTCADLVNPRTGVSDCPSRAYLCNNPLYYNLMTQQCPKTCNRCTNRTSQARRAIINQ
ncbi:shTK domain protein [Oesophagostomum dentatum]|uniref:ShTK domain protein n=1 Tax=Oesophagostomum dentatum TaxID=61180 RepID=A0A0B1SU06_OESDE|nr:shTK domain protein [Oesophagostomum dentatum]